MKFCMPIVEAKQYITSNFDVLSFAIHEGSASALLQNSVNEVLYHVQYFPGAYGDIACFSKIVGGLLI